MKELKFRAWSNEYDQYCSGLQCDIDFGWEGILESEFEYQTDPDPVIEQYTGLKDKNGKEIYEGDIVTLDGEWEVIKDTDCSVITFENGCFRVGDGYENEAGSYLSDWRVIGNVHENANLLEKK